MYTQHITLSTSTGNRRVDTALGGRIGIFEMTFPERIRAYYLEGGYAHGSAVVTSDIDPHIKAVLHDLQYDLIDDVRAAAEQALK